MMNTPHILDELHWRGLVQQCTDETMLREFLSTSRTVYAGFDPTAPSLHCGSLLPLMMLRRFQRAGHTPIALVGGATGMIGDPSGKSQERVLLSPDLLQENVLGMQAQMSSVLDFDGKFAARLVNNFDWMQNWSYINFLRDVGKNFPVNVMLAKDSVKNRLQRDDSGLSYTEFSYMLLQAYDFAHLSEQYDCRLQIGGSDQWGNITAGIDLARRMHSKQLFGLTCPLLLTSDGRKMGKTESGAVWLDPARTSPYAFYQYWVNVGDADVIMCLRFLTELDEEEIQSLELAVADEPHKREAQKRLASWLTQFLHGDAGLNAALKATEILFGAEIEGVSDLQLGEIFHDVPSGTISSEQLSSGMPLVDALVTVALAKSKTEARRTIEQGGGYVNNRRINDAAYTLSRQDLVSESIVVLRSGRKKFALLRVT
ncbi:MAG: tyrosine--tRNA ligase [Planctomycetales bacterium]|nr:tyrosine--tRNA ligase [Planctomycetales bacterium]